MEGSEEQDGVALLASIEADLTSTRCARGEAFRKAHALFAQQQDAASAELALALHVAFSFVNVADIARFSARKPRFSPLLAEMLPPERWEHIRGYRDQTHNPAIGAHLSDLLWEGYRDPDAARDAVTSYLAYAAAIPYEGDVQLDVADALIRSLEVSLQLHDEELVSRSLDQTLTVVRSTVSRGIARWAYEPLRELLFAKPVRGKLPFSELEDLVEDALRGLDPDLTGLWEQNWLVLLERLGHVARKPELLRRARLRLGESRERIGDLCFDRDVLKAIIGYQQAAAWFQRAGGCAERVGGVMRKLEDATAASHSEMKAVTVSAEVAGETMAKWQSEVLRLYDAARHRCVSRRRLRSA